MAIGTSLVFASALAYSIYLLKGGELMVRLGGLRVSAIATSIGTGLLLGHLGLRGDVAQLWSQTAEVYALTLILALSYGGREEIIDGVKSIVDAVEKGHIDKAMIDKEMFGKHLYTRYYPDPDLLIRTSGEMRLSNVLLWQLSYTEFYITDKLWPDFRKDELREAIRAYGTRHRRFGGV